MADKNWNPFATLTNHEKFELDCDDISSRYDGDFDTMPGLPPVTSMEMRLLQLIIELEDRVHELEERMN